MKMPLLFFLFAVVVVVVVVGHCESRVVGSWQSRNSDVVRLSLCVERSEAKWKRRIHNVPLLFFLFAVVVYIIEQRLNISRERAHTIPNLLGRAPLHSIIGLETNCVSPRGNNWGMLCNQLPK
jgi:hypothetical protein